MGEHQVLLLPRAWLGDPREVELAGGDHHRSGGLGSSFGLRALGVLGAHATLALQGARCDRVAVDVDVAELVVRTSELQGLDRSGFVARLTSEGGRIHQPREVEVRLLALHLLRGQLGVVREVARLHIRYPEGLPGRFDVELDVGLLLVEFGRRDLEALHERRVQTCEDHRCDHPEGDRDHR